MTRSTSTDRRLVKDDAVRVSRDKVIDDCGVDEAGRDGEEDVVQSGSMTVVVVRGADDVDCKVSVAVNNAADSQR